jgi:hypothetical protein
LDAKRLLYLVVFIAFPSAVVASYQFGYSIPGIQSGPLVYQTATATVTPIVTVQVTSTQPGYTITGLFTQSETLTYVFSQTSVLQTTSTQLTTTTASSTTATSSVVSTLTTSTTSTVGVSTYTPSPCDLDPNLCGRQGDLALILTRLGFAPIVVGQQQGRLFIPEPNKAIAISDWLLVAGSIVTVLGFILLVRK